MLFTPWRRQTIANHEYRTSQDVLDELPKKTNMARRSKDWNEGLAENLQDPEFAREFLTAAVEEGVSLQTALSKVIRATGVKEFALSVGMPSPNVLGAIDPKHNPTQETLERLLKPFGLRIRLAQIKRRMRRAA